MNSEDRYPYALEREAVEALNDTFKRGWRLHWNAMFSSRCVCCPRFVERGDNYYHHPSGMSCHEDCAHRLAKEMQALGWNCGA